MTLGFLLGQHFPNVMLSTGSKPPEPLLETGHLVLWFAQCQNPPAPSVGGTGEFRTGAGPIDFIIRGLSVASPSNLPPRELASEKRQTSPPGWDCVKEDIRSAPSYRQSGLAVDPEG